MQFFYDKLLLILRYKLNVIPIKLYAMKLIKCCWSINIPRRLSTIVPFLLYILFILFILNISFPLKTLTSKTNRSNGDNINNYHKSIIKKTMFSNPLEKEKSLPNEKLTNTIKKKPKENKELELAFQR